MCQSLDVDSISGYQVQMPIRSFSIIKQRAKSFELVFVKSVFWSDEINLVYSKNKSERPEKSSRLF